MRNRFKALMPDVERVLHARATLRDKVAAYAPPQGDERRFLRITNRDADTAEVMLYDEIGGWLGISALNFANELRDVKAGNINVRINSPGGDVFDSVAIYNALRDHPAKVHVRVDGLAASGASVVAMAGDTVEMNRGAQMMIHDAYTVAIGNEADLIETANLLGRLSDNIAGLYADRAGGQPDDWRALMRTETWYSPAEAVAAGLADTATGDDKGDGGGAATAAYDLTVFAFAGRVAAPAPVANKTHNDADLEPEEPFINPKYLRKAAKEALR